MFCLSINNSPDLDVATIKVNAYRHDEMPTIRIELATRAGRAEIVVGYKEAGELVGMIENVIGLSCVPLSERKR